MTPDPITVLMVDDHPIFLEGVASALEAMPGVRLVQAGSGGEAVALHRRVSAR